MQVNEGLQFMVLEVAMIIVIYGNVMLIIDYYRLKTDGYFLLLFMCGC